MDVAILAVAAQGSRVRGIIQAEEDKTAHATRVTGRNTNSDTIVGLFVDNDVVAAAKGKGLNEVAREILVVVKKDGSILGINFEEL